MPTAEAMTIDESGKYLGLMTIQYVRARKKERSHRLDDMEHFRGLDRKTLVRLINGRPGPPPAPETTPVHLRCCGA